MGKSFGRMAAGSFPRSVLALLLALLLSFGWMPATSFAEEDGSHYIFGKSTEYSTFTSGGELTDSFYYSDDWFAQDPAARNDSLALVSMQAVAASCEEDADGYGGDFLRGLGFENVTFAGAGMSDPEACNYLYGTKTVSGDDGDYTLVAVVIQSYTFDNEVKEQGWRQNFKVNNPDAESQPAEHFGFAQAADAVTPAIESLGGSGQTKYWIMGQSRGGALTNLIAKRLGDAGNTVYAYTFESPATVDADVAGGDYGYIHNYLCRDDIVTKIPVWGMTRYGNTYEIRDETADGIVEELEKLGSDAAAEYEYPPDAEWIETDIVDYLGERVPERADYSAERSDTFTDANTGEEVTLTYSYQEGLVALMGVLFSGELSGAADAILGDLEEAAPTVFALAEAVNRDGSAEAAPYYWEAAKGLHALLGTASEQPLSLSEQDLYAILRLIGPFAIDTDYEPSDDPGSAVMGYLSPVVNVGISASGMTYSHQFDTLIARLKVLAPAPEMEDVDITITEPAAGDDAEKAPEEVTDFFDDDAFRDANGDLWITATAAWDTGDEVLQDDYVYYLDVTLVTVGHTIPEDLGLTLNGQAPAKGPSVTYDEATGVTRATFEFVIGEPPEIAVSFDADGKAEDPSSITVKRGTALFTQDRPQIEELVTLDGVKYKLQDWYDDEGVAWDDVKVDRALTMHAKWLLYVDRIEVSIKIPALGDPILDATVPEDAPYYISTQYCSNPEWETATEATLEGTYSFEVCVALKDPENSIFALETSEWDTLEYIGTMTVNGEEVACSYEPDLDEVFTTYPFEVTEAPSEETKYKFTEGAGQTWIRGLEEPAVFTVKRTEDDAATFDHFTGILVDGEAVSPDDYTAEAGSVILSLKPAYLESLDSGRHKLTVQFDDGKAVTRFTVADETIDLDDEDTPMAPGEADGVPRGGGAGKTEKSDQTAKTGDDSQPLLGLTVMLGSLAVLSGLAAAKRRPHRTDK